MKYLFVALCCMVVLLLIWINRVRKSEAELKKPILHLLWLAVFMVVIKGIFLICENRITATLAIGCYYSGIDWLLIVLLSYEEAYTQIFRGNKVFKRVTYGLAALDSLSMFLNVFFGHIFVVVQHVYSDGYDEWSIIRSTVPFTLHLVFTYVLVILCVSLLVEKTVRTPATYRRKYLVVLILLLITVVVNGICMLAKSPYDISVFFYCALGIQMSYYSLFYNPKGLIDSTMALVVADISDAVFCFDIRGKCVYTNKMVGEYFGSDTNFDVVNLMFEDRIKEYSKSEQESAQYKVQREMDGKLRFFDVSYHKLSDKKHRYIGCFFTLRDRTEEIEKFKEEHYRLSHDKLTGLFNREYFFEAVEKVLAANPDVEYTMVCSNIKGFKLYNDLFGEKKGDEVLKMEAELLMQNAGDNTVYGRISGDEFAILVPTKLFTPDIFIHNINLLKERFNSSQYQMHIYIGIYEIHDKTEPVSVMCDKAKLAIESHRGDYNAVVTSYDKKLLAKSLYERKIVGEFDRALERDEFCMFLQPQIASDGRVLGAEALVRWQHPERGLVFPGDFIGVFEKTGLIYRLDRYMWEQAAKKLREWKDTGKEDMHISVNISAKDFYHMDIYRELTGLVEKYDIAPENLKLEITETALMTEMKNQADLLGRLREFGFRIEIDDFGSGYSSLNMLKSIDVDIVKIDMGFLDKTERLERGESILNSIILLIKNLGMGVITEGVETREQVDSLLGMGCNMFQGYYFAKPMTIEMFEEKYK